MDDSAKSESALQAVADFSLWLEETNEFACAPKTCEVVASYLAPWPWEPDELEVHLLQFVLPNGREGIGIAGPVAYSFSDRDIDFSLFSPDELLKLYAGWYLLYELISSDEYQPNFEPLDDQAIIEMLGEEHGITDIQIVDRVQIEDQTFFEMTGVDNGEPCRIGGSFDGCFCFFPDDKYYGLPALYYVMGWVFYSDEEDDEFEDDDDDDDSDDDELAESGEEE